MGTYIVVTTILLLTLFPVLLPLAITVAPMGAAGARRVRSSIANGLGIFTRTIGEQRAATSRRAEASAVAA